MKMLQLIFNIVNDRWILNYELPNDKISLKKAHRYAYFNLSALVKEIIILILAIIFNTCCIVLIHRYLFSDIEYDTVDYCPVGSKYFNRSIAEDLTNDIFHLAHEKMHAYNDSLFENKVKEAHEHGHGKHSHHKHGKIHKPKQPKAIKSERQRHLQEMHNIRTLIKQEQLTNAKPKKPKSFHDYFKIEVSNCLCQINDDMDLERRIHTVYDSKHKHAWYQPNPYYLDVELDYCCHIGFEFGENLDFWIFIPFVILLLCEVLGGIWILRDVKLLVYVIFYKYFGQGKVVRDWHQYHMEKAFGIKTKTNKKPKLRRFATSSWFRTSVATMRRFGSQIVSLQRLSLARPIMVDQNLYIINDKDFVQLRNHREKNNNRSTPVDSTREHSEVHRNCVHKQEKKVCRYW